MDIDKIVLDDDRLSAAVEAANEANIAGYDDHEQLCSGIIAYLHGSNKPDTFYLALKLQGVRDLLDAVDEACKSAWRSPEQTLRFKEQRKQLRMMIKGATKS